MSDIATPTSVRATWARMYQAHAAQPLHKRVLESGGPELYFSVDAAGRRGLMAIGRTRVSPDLIPLESLSITEGRRQSGEWSATLSLKDETLGQPFCQLCALICTAAARCSASEDAIQLLTDEVQEWRRLMKLGASDRLSPFEQRGLFAELAILRVLLHTRNAVEVLAAWRGPRGAPQDFQFGDVHLECKAVAVHDTHVRISSLEQLDVSEVRLYLVAVPISEGEIGRSLQDAVTELRQVLQSCPESALLFEAGLTTVGFSDRFDYSTPTYAEHKTRWFEIQDHFPRLCRNGLHPAITAVRYELDISMLSEHRVEAPLL